MLGCPFRHLLSQAAVELAAHHDELAAPGGAESVATASGCDRGRATDRGPGHGRDHGRDQRGQEGGPSTRCATAVSGLCRDKTENGIVTVHVGMAVGRFQALVDEDLYPPKSWDQDRERCRAAGIPDEVRYRTKWKIALAQLVRLDRNGVRLDWLTFDEGYGTVLFSPGKRELRSRSGEQSITSSALPATTIHGRHSPLIPAVTRRCVRGRGSACPRGRGP